MSEPSRFVWGWAVHARRHLSADFAPKRAPDEGAHPGAAGPVSAPTLDPDDGAAEGTLDGWVLGCASGNDRG